MVQQQRARRRMCEHRHVGPYRSFISPPPSLAGGAPLEPPVPELGAVLGAASAPEGAGAAAAVPVDDAVVVSDVDVAGADAGAADAAVAVAAAGAAAAAVAGAGVDVTEAIRLA